MKDEPGYEGVIESNALKQPRRVAFITPATSAQVKGEEPGKLMTYPHLILREGIMFHVVTILLVILALAWDAPLEQLANPLLTPNPAKAPWYFLGLQEMLHYFPPLVAGIAIPGLVVAALIVIPYFNVNVEGKALFREGARRRALLFFAVLAGLVIFSIAFDAWTVAAPTAAVGAVALLGYSGRGGRPARFLKARPISWWIMSWFIAVALVLTLVGTFFRGPGWAWTWPWSPK